MTRRERKRAWGREAALYYLGHERTLAHVAVLFRMSPTALHYHVALLRKERDGNGRGPWPEDELTC